jgi:hypothetical protein
MDGNWKRAGSAQGGAMTELVIALSIAVLAAIGAIAIFIVLWRSPARDKRLMRCPEDGSIAFVDAGPAVGEGAARGVTVHWCDLWPAKKDCAQGCLVRYPQSRPGYRVNLEALRPFDRR